MSVQQKISALLKQVKVLEKQLHLTQQELSYEKWHSDGLYDYVDRLHKKYKRLKSFAKQAILKGAVTL